MAVCGQAATTLASHMLINGIIAYKEADQPKMVLAGIAYVTTKLKVPMTNLHPALQAKVNQVQSSATALAERDNAKGAAAAKVDSTPSRSSAAATQQLQSRASREAWTPATRPAKRLRTG